MKQSKGITLITLIITIILLIILAGVVINLALGENGLFNKAKQAKDETEKQAATEKINLKITNTQIGTYSKEQRMPTLQELADNFCEDDEIEYVELESKQLASLDKIEIGENDSFFTKLKEYPYEFEINSSLQLASIDGIQIATNDTVTIPKDEYDRLKNANKYSTEEIIIGTWIDGKPIYRKVYTGLSVVTGTTKNWINIVSVNDIDALINTKCLFNNNREEYIPLEFYYDGSNVRILTTTLTGSSRTLTTCIMEYTKTTDNAS